MLSLHGKFTKAQSKGAEESVCRVPLHQVEIAIGEKLIINIVMGSFSYSELLNLDKKFATKRYRRCDVKSVNRAPEK